MNESRRELSIVTGASSGIGFELARLCAKAHHDLIIAADEEAINEAASDLQAEGGSVIPLMCDLSTREGIKALLAQLLVCDRPVDYLFANAGRGLGHGFLDQDIQDAMRVSHTNIDGTLYLVHALGRAMRSRGRGRMLITGSIAGFMPGAFQAVYNGSAAFLDSFAIALANELKGSGVTVTCLMPGPTDTAFFERADMLDTKIAAGSKADAAEVARIGFDAMMRGESGVVAGLSNKFRAAMAHVTPDSLLAEMQRGDAAPGSGRLS